MMTKLIIYIIYLFSFEKASKLNINLDLEYADEANHANESLQE